MLQVTHFWVWWSPKKEFWKWGSDVMNEWWWKSQLALRLAVFLSFKESITTGLHLKPEKAFSGDGQSAQHLHHHILHFRFTLLSAKPSLMINLSLSTSTSVFLFCKIIKPHFSLRNSTSKLICRNLSVCNQPLMRHRMSLTFHLLVQHIFATNELNHKDCGFNHCMLSMFLKHCHIIIRQRECRHSDRRCVSLYSVAVIVIDS